MPLPTGTTGGSGLSRSEAAILAWKKRPRAKPKNGALDPKIAARVKEILAAKQKKGKPKAKAKGKAAKPKETRTKQEVANQNRAAVAKQGGMGDLEGTLVRLNAGMQGAGMENDKHDELIKKGLAKRGADGSVSLSPAGKKWKSAADKGNAECANAALSDAKAGAAAREGKEQERSAKKQARDTAKAERVAVQAKKQQDRQKKLKQAAQSKRAKGKARASAKTERAKQTQAKQAATQQRKTRVLAEKVKRGEKLSASDQIDAEDAGIVKAGKALDMSELAIKAGARHSRTDIQHLQSIHDSSVACGASCGPEDDDSDAGDLDEDDEGVKAIKGIMGNPLYYAQHECQDIMQAANALSTMAMLIQSELVEEDEDPQHIAMLCDAAHTLVDFIDSELDELEKAGKDAAHDAGMGPMKAITEREDVNPKAGVAEYGDVTFADAKNKKYPIDTADHTRSALSYFSKEENKAKYSAEDQKSIMAKIVAAWKKLIDKAGPPSAGKAMDDAWLHLEGDAIKALENDIIRGYAVRFGDADHADLQHDYYTKATDFWLDHFGWPRPITYHHGMDAGTRNDPVVGHWLKAGVDDVGIWMEGQMDRAHAYYKAMKELAARGYIRLSSDSAPQWVIREKQQNGVNEIKRWPLITSSLTVTPMEPRMLPVEVKAFLAELGFEGIDDSPEVINPDAARLDEAKAADDERARVLLLELDLLELETA